MIAKCDMCDRTVDPVTICHVLTGLIKDAIICDKCKINIEAYKKGLSEWT